jgi:methyltransferase (TIGR00027 family)
MKGSSESMSTTRHGGWDLASEVGLTATEAAAARAAATSRPLALIDDQFAGPLVRAVGVDYFCELATGTHPGFALPRMVDWVAARTRFFDDYLVEAVAEGVGQVVILGAGLDCRAYRLPLSADFVVYELDQPQVLGFKNATLMGMGASPLTARVPVAVDLRGDWASVLGAVGFDTAVPTAWIAEGFMPYLPGDAQDRLLDKVTDLSAGGSRFGADVVDDVSSLTARITASFEATARPKEFSAPIGGIGDATHTDRREVNVGLWDRGWASLVLGAADVFDRYGVRLDAEAEATYRQIDFVVAVI